MDKVEISNKDYVGERPLYGQSDLHLIGCSFADGESPIKECSNIEIENCTFKWKYPIWYCSDIVVCNSKWEEMARAGVWYSKNLKFDNVQIEAPKNFRRCKNITLKNVTIPHAQETLWNCDGITLSDVVANGDYFAMGSSNIKVNNFFLEGNYSFDGCKNIEVHNAKMLSKDSFWNCDNVTVYDSFISGEYIGWNSSNITFVNCTIESLQGLCYIDNLVMKNCKTLNTNLAFEYSTVNVEIEGGIVSILNPKGGLIKCGSIEELILENKRIDVDATTIEAHTITRQLDKPEWI